MKRFYGIGILIILILLFFLPPLLTPNSVYAPADLIYMNKPWNEYYNITPQNVQQEDALTQFIPWRKYFYDQMHQGRFPLWNPYTFGGMPFFANDQSAVLSIYNLFSLPFSFEKSFLVSAILRLIVTGIGMYLLLDFFSLDIYACLLGSIAWVFSAFTITWIYSTTGAAGSFIPWFFYGFERLIKAVQDKQKRSLSIALFVFSFSIGLSFLAGHAEATVNGLIGLIIYGFVRILFTKKYIFKSIFYAGLGVICGFLLASVQLFPFMQALWHSEPFWFRMYYAKDIRLSFIPLHYLTTWIVPNIFGNPSFHYLLSLYPAGVGWAAWNRLIAYIGITPLMLGIYAIAQIKKSYKTITPFLILAIIGGFFAYGISSFAWILKMPILNGGYQSNYIIQMGFVLAVLSGFGANFILNSLRDNTDRVHTVKIFGTVVTGLLISIGLYLLTRYHTDWLIAVGEWLPSPSYIGLKGMNGLQWIFILIQIVLAFLFIALTIFLLFNKKINSRQRGILLLIVTITDVFIFGIGYNPLSSQKDLSVTTPLITKLTDLHPFDYSMFAIGRNIILPDINMNYSIRDFRGYDIMVSMRYNNFLRVLYHDNTLMIGSYGGVGEIHKPPDPITSAIAGIKYIVIDSSRLLNSIYYKPIGTYKDLVLYENPSAKPLIYLASSVSPTSEEDALYLLSHPVPGLLDTTLVDGIDEQGSVDTSLIHLQRIKDEPGEHVIKVDAGTNGFLVINEPYYPGWHAYVDGKRVEMYHVNYLFQGIKLPQGQYTVRVEYAPGMFYFGLIVSIITLVIMGITTLAVLLARK